MVKLKNNHRHPRSCIQIHHAQKNFVSLLASSHLKRWIIILFLFYKLDYKDYYCYGISSSSAILNNENGKDLVLSFSCVAENFSFLILHLVKVNLLSRLPSLLETGDGSCFCFICCSFFSFPNENQIE